MKMDLHAPGIFAVIDPAGAMLCDTTSTTGYSARATFCREYNMLWSKARADGFRIARLTIVEMSEETPTTG